MTDAPGAVPLAAVAEPAGRDADPVGKGGLGWTNVEPLEGAGAFVVATGVLLSGVAEASAAAVVVASGAGVLDGSAGTAVAAHLHTSSPAD